MGFDACGHRCLSDNRNISDVCSLCARGWKQCVDGFSVIFRSPSLQCIAISHQFCWKTSWQYVVTEHVKILPMHLFWPLTYTVLYVLQKPRRRTRRSSGYPLSSRENFGPTTMGYLGQNPSLAAKRLHYYWKMLCFILTTAVSVPLSGVLKQFALEKAKLSQFVVQWEVRVMPY